uniref:Uncharacterized protein n=1 Tax=Arundo donax TaxID=35708 RepID=A0A0A9HMS5_ARUDO
MLQSFSNHDQTAAAPRGTCRARARSSSRATW